MGCPETEGNDGCLQGTAKFLLFESILISMVALASLEAGICAVIFAKPAEYSFKWPLSSFSGIWAPLIALVLGITGCIAFTRDNFSGEVYTRRKWVGVFWGFLIASVATAPQHMAYSGSALASCVSESLDVCQAWVTAQPFLVAEGFCVAFGTITFLLCVGTLFFLWRSRTIYKLMGVKYRGCCGSGEC